jgi:hypothetical protein
VKELGGTHGWRWPHEMKIMMVVSTHVMTKLWTLEKKKEKNKMGSRQR